MKNGLISVIVPIYKVEKYLIKCIDSIISQTYRNIEIILVDDGSPDGCSEICDEYKLKDKRIVVVHKTNGGLSDARNTGLEIAGGEYITFVDSDDFIDSHYLEKLYRALKYNNADMAVCNLKNVDKNGNCINSKSPIENELLTAEAFCHKFVIHGDDGFYYAIACNRLYTRKAIGNVRFPVGKVHEDEFVSHRFAFNCDRIVTIKDILYYYLRRSESITGKPVSIKYLDFIEANFDRLNFYIDHEFYIDVDMLVNLIHEQYTYYKRQFYKENKQRFSELEPEFNYALKHARHYIKSYKVKLKTYIPYSFYYLKEFKSILLRRLKEC